ncbi:hypothetical protein [Methanosarcina spelaei]|uniref:hypothetical protein n=1 Tax=Methanosarcina spelaei TaxID=1036679 RepID=UPI0034E07B0F
MDFVVEYAKQNGGKKVSIGIINENEKLKNWYKKYGFKETGLKNLNICLLLFVLWRRFFYKHTESLVITSSVFPFPLHSKGFVLIRFF